MQNSRHSNVFLYHKNNFFSQQVRTILVTKYHYFFAAPTTAAADLSELNLHCEENELGAIIVKSTLEKKVESEESEESSDQSFDLMCRETLSSPINAK